MPRHSASSRPRSLNTAPLDLANAANSATPFPVSIVVSSFRAPEDLVPSSACTAGDPSRSHLNVMSVAFTNEVTTALATSSPFASSFSPAEKVARNRS